jgi:hypothetical protein
MSTSAMPPPYRSTAEIQANATRLALRAQRSLSPDGGEPAGCETSGAALNIFYLKLIKLKINNE